MLAKNQASQMLLIAIEKGTNHVPFSIALMSAHPETAIFSRHPRALFSRHPRAGGDPVSVNYRTQSTLSVTAKPFKNSANIIVKILP
jgi:hypothetical protein